MLAIGSFSTEEPNSDNPYVKAVAYYTWIENDSITVRFQYPFDEFYMDEFKAPKAEVIYREITLNSLNSTYALVKIYKGDAVVENVFINEHSY